MSALADTQPNESRQIIPVSAREVVDRINRRLAKDDLVVVQLHDCAAIDEHGEYVVVPVPSVADVIGHGAAGPLSRVEQENVDIEKLGRELRVLRRGERVAIEG